MRPSDAQRAVELKSALDTYSKRTRKLKGVSNNSSRDAFIEQLLESIRRVKYVEVIRSREVSQQRTIGSNELFDPVKAAIYFLRQGNFDEACWMTFMFTHFGRHPKNGLAISQRCVRPTPWPRSMELGRSEWKSWLIPTMVESEPSPFEGW